MPTSFPTSETTGKRWMPAFDIRRAASYKDASFSITRTIGDIHSAAVAPPRPAGSSLDRP